MLKTLLAAALAASFLVACGPREQPAAVAPAAPPAEPKVLNIYNWPDYVPPGLIEAFEQETGIDVTYDTFASNEVLHARLVAGNTGYDIVVPGSVFAAQQIAAGFFQPLDKSKIPNLANMDPALMATLTKADPENRHLVPWAWGFTTVGINRTRLERALGNTPMPENAWELVFNPKYTALAQRCGIAFLDAPSEVIPPALHFIGREAYSNNPADYQAALEMLMTVRPHIRIFTSTMIDTFAGGQACVVLGWSGDINIAANRAREMGNTDVLEALLPSTGGLIFIDTMAITRDARHPNNAHTFINFFLRPENAARMANEMNFPTGNLAAMPLIRPEIAGNKTIMVPADYMPRMIQPGSLSNEAREAMATAYNSFKQGR